MWNPPEVSARAQEFGWTQPGCKAQFTQCVPEHGTVRDLCAWLSMWDLCEWACRCGGGVARLLPEGLVRRRKKPFKDFQLRREIVILVYVKESSRLPVCLGWRQSPEFAPAPTASPNHTGQVQVAWAACSSCTQHTGEKGNTVSSSFCREEKYPTWHSQLQSQDRAQGFSLGIWIWWRLWSSLNLYLSRVSYCTFLMGTVQLPGLSWPPFGVSNKILFHSF